MLLAELARFGDSDSRAVIGPRLSIDQVRSSSRAMRLGSNVRASPDLLSISTLAARISVSRDDPAALQATALIDLRWGDSSVVTIGRVIDALHAAARLSIAKGPILADLAAALLVRAEREADGQSLLEAIETASRALGVEPDNVAARFNLTLALDRAGLVSEAARSGRVYLGLDASSPWAVRIRSIVQASLAIEREAALATVSDSASAAAMARRDPEAARKLGWQSILPRWAELSIMGDAPGAAHQLRLAEDLGRALITGGGDATLSDAVLAIRRSAADSTGDSQLQQAHRAFARGDSLFWSPDYEHARAAFTDALAEAGRSPVLRLWTQARLGAALIAQGHTDAGERLLRHTIAEADTVRHTALVGRAFASLATALLRAGRDDDAARAINDAERFLTRSGEVEILGAVQSLRADAELRRGDESNGYAAALRALATLRTRPHSIWRHNALYVLAEETLAEGLPAAASLFQDEGVAAAAGTGRPLDLAEALLARARLRASTGDQHGLAADVQQAGRLVTSAPASSDRMWLEADLHLSEAAALIATEPAIAGSHADSAVAFFARRDIVLRLAPALTVRAEARAMVGNTEGALADLEYAARILDDRAARMQDANARQQLLTNARRVLDRIILMRVARGESTEALIDLERARDLLAPGPRPSRRPQLLRLTGETGIILFRVADTLLTWTIGDTVVRFRRATVDAAAFDQLVDRTRTMLELRQSPSALRPLLTALYDTILRPVEHLLGRPDRSLVFVTDGALAAVPFAALYDARHGRYLVEDHPMRFAASLRDATEKDRPRGPPHHRASGDNKVLLVGDPAFDVGAHPTLRRLAGARREVATLTHQYPSARVLETDSASKHRVLQEMTHARIIHYAGHAVLDDRQPQRTYLLLARDAGMAQDSTTLSAAAVSGLPLGKLELVVLSACQTVGGRRDLLDGTAGMAGAFRLAGASGVLGATWRVDDELTRPLMLAFHREYALSGDGPAALRTAQRALLASPQAALHSPSAWAAFRYLGR